MANLTPAAGYDNVPQLDTTTPVLGGAGGPSNSQAQALLNRTEQLKNEMANKPDRTSATPATQTVGAAAAVGTSQEAARADHRHAMPGLASETEAGFIELATPAEAQALADALRALTPATLAAVSTSLATALRLVLRDAGGGFAAGPVSVSNLAYSGEGTTTSNSGFQVPVGTTAQRPTAANGKVRFNTTTNQYEGYNASLGVWAPLGGGAKGAGVDDIFYENSKVVTQSYTLTTDKNAMSAGPITINDGVVVTVPTGQTWTIV